MNRLNKFTLAHPFNATAIDKNPVFRGVSDIEHLNQKNNGLPDCSGVTVNLMSQASFFRPSELLNSDRLQWLFGQLPQDVLEGAAHRRNCTD